ncbi:glucosylceramidase [Mucilaginibacter limnophilus]|uniref:Glucosylceramidase n=1 Tax=Mucilaginibacter limnophilus TaxID=1932778 RepID=A0A437MZB5_9SPHI|nr:glycoside hydrolase family 30 beta sandwich domain-containing protein [Mucilaginibacter limnophilus]RVU03002.1 glucosylceramidase [Mucilaginibacter limnophilus]
MKKHLLLLIFVSSLTPCLAQTAEMWLTTNDRSSLLKKQSASKFGSSDTTGKVLIKVFPDVKFQEIDGFGLALTGGSAQHINRMSAAERKKLLNELFGSAANGVSISYLRLSIGASDLNDHTFSYDDIPAGQTDTELKRFTLQEDEKDIIPVLKEILAINPTIKIMGSPWSAPVWMKTNSNIQGGMLKKAYYPVYAQYFVRYIQGMQKHGIVIDAVTVQNEPFNDGNTPSMQFFAKDEAAFIRDHLGPAFKKVGIKTKIILYDHNCDAPEYPISILNDNEAAKYIDGSGFHLYAGQITAMSKVYNAFPDKKLYFTEMMAVSRDGNFNTANPVARIVIGAMRNWSRNVILWNLAADKFNKPHTDNGGCTMCQGAVTIDGDKVEHNLAYYTIAHASKFVPTGSVRVESTDFTLPNVAFLTPGGKIVLIVANNNQDVTNFTVYCKGKTISSTLPAGSTATYVW